MREEVSKRWKQALKDFESAKKNLESEEYYVPAFRSQQAVEKPFFQKESFTKGILDLIYDRKAPFGCKLANAEQMVVSI